MANIVIMSLSMQMAHSLIKLCKASPPHPRPGFFRRDGDQGFTLPEVLIASLIAALIVGVTAQVMIGQLLEGRRLEAAQRVRENFSRFNYLVQVEASEANRILDSAPAVPGCAGADVGFTLSIPVPEGPYAVEENRSNVQYFNDEDGNISRCGPSVTRAGILEHPPVGSDGSFDAGTTHQTDVVVPNATLALGCGVRDGEREIGYQINFTGGNFGVQVDECVVAHAKSIFVCNPAPADPLIPFRQGDCPRP